MSSEHEALPPERQTHPGGKDGYYRCACKCGDYVSGFHFYPGHAEIAARAHADAKNRVSQ